MIDDELIEKYKEEVPEKILQEILVILNSQDPTKAQEKLMAICIAIGQNHRTDQENIKWNLRSMGSSYNLIPKLHGGNEKQIADLLPGIADTIWQSLLWIAPENKE